MAGTNTRLYTQADLQKIMAHVIGWAENWQDVYWYVATIGRYDLPESKVTPLLDDLQTLQNAPYSPDYRRLYQLIFGQPCNNCPDPMPDQKYYINHRELVNKWLNGLVFPATSRDIVFCAEGNNAPKDVEDILRTIPDMHYRNFHELMQRVDADVDRRNSNTQ